MFHCAEHCGRFAVVRWFAAAERLTALARLDRDVEHTARLDREVDQHRAARSGC